MARHVAVDLIRYRSEKRLPQRALAKQLGLRRARVVELESGEKNPQFDTLARIVAVTGLEFAISFARSGEDHRLVWKVTAAASSHSFGGASVVVVSR